MHTKRFQAMNSRRILQIAEEGTAGSIKAWDFLIASET